MRPLPEPLARRPFSVATATDLGVPASRLRRGDLDAPFPGVRVPRVLEPDFELRCRAYAERMAPTHYFSHLTAARLLGVWLPRSPLPDEQLHVTAPLPARAPRVPGVIGHQVDAERATQIVVRGLSASAPLETVRGLATVLSLDQLVAACDWLVKRKSPVAGMEDLREMAADHHGRGARLLRQAVDLSRAGADSPRETRLRLLLRSAALPEPEVNGVISRPGASVTRYGDLVFREWGVVVEYEGTHHSEDRASYVTDIARYEELSEWRFVRVAKEHFSAPLGIVRRVVTALRDRGWPG